MYVRILREGENCGVQVLFRYVVRHQTMCWLDER